MIYDKNYYLDIFKITENNLKTIAAEGLSKGGDYSDLFFENTFYTQLMLKDGNVTSGGFNVDYGVGIRVLKGEKTGYAYSEKTDIKSMTEAARTAASIAGNSGNPSSPINVDKLLRDARDTATFVKAGNNGDRMIRKFFPGEPNPAADRYPFAEDWKKTETSVLIPFLDKLQNRLASCDDRIIKIIAMLSGQTSDYLMYNSFREMKYDTKPMGSISVSVIFSKNGKTESKSFSRSFRMGTEMLTDTLIDELASKAVEGIDDMFAAKRPKGGKMPVVMSAGASGILLHEAMGHAFEADFIRKGQSIFNGRMGQKICDGKINIVDDGTIKGNRGSLNFDDEGVPGQKTYMVSNGILTSYLHDRISAKFFGVSPTGNGRRESFRYNPVPRMRATYMENGDADKTDIISSVKKGIYVCDFSNGQVKIGEGDFTFYVKRSYLIENGKLTRPLKDINIIGNGPQALADIIAVGNDLKIDDSTWTCGKEQNVPVSCGIPTVLVKSLTVGGE
ncbi:MAG: TldD/PmbA family protein [Bacteroidales bacterium]|jgi:TldD protein|nr:TldD/PmbA family protein [Bacteroidales bacterium]MCI1785889.1 TldD/PmbA family protein [Bacteroidales bacterium]